MTVRPRSAEAPRLWLLYACFVASGAAGLILEIVWSKYLSLLMGNSIYGVSTVVAAFLGGLGLGAWIGGRVAARAREPLLLYARLEAAVGLLALLSPLGYLGSRPLFASLYSATGGAGAVFLTVRFLLLFVALLAPTIAMGASLPLLVSDLTRRGAAFASSIGSLYALNTAGAVLGVASAGFLLIPILGLWRTAVVAAALDLLVAVVVMRGRPAPPPFFQGAPASRGENPTPSFLSRLIIPVFALSGFTAILYEIAWTRILSVPLGGMVYALSAILGLYLLGIAVGSTIAERLLRRFPVPVVLFGIFQLLLGMSVALGSHLFGLVPGWETSLIVSSIGSALRLFAGETAIAALFVLPPALMLGALFPLAAAIRQGGRGEAGASVGAVYAANTFGSIAGSLATGFLLIPWLGAMNALLGAAAINASIGALALWLGEGKPAPRRLFAALAAAGIVLFGFVARPAWPAQRMSLGFTRLLRAYRFSASGHGEAVAREMIATSGSPQGSEQLRFYREGRLATVAVLESPGRMALIVNGKPDATTGTGEDMMTQVMLGQIPLLLAPRARDVCIIGYGSGVTTHSVLTHPVREALTVEIERAVIDAAPYFRDGAFDPLSDPRSRLLVEDAGTFLRSTSRRFDVIISEPSNPWLAGIGDLFTREFYDQARSRLEPGGLFCQWLQCYEISPQTMWTIFRTLSSRFQSGHVFFFRPSNDLVIIASPDRDLLLDPGTMTAAFGRKEVADDLARVEVVSIPDLLRYYRGSLQRIARMGGDGPINTDDNGWLEHRAPLDLIIPPTRGEPLGWSNEVADDLAAALGANADRASDMLRLAADRALEVPDRAAARGFSLALRRIGHAQDADAIGPRLAALDQRMDAMKQARAILDEATPLVSRASEEGNLQLGTRAAEMLGHAAQLDPSDGEIAWRWGTALIAAHRTTEAIGQLRRALELLPAARHFPVRRDLAISYFFMQDPDSALRELDEMDRLRAGSAEARYWRTRVFLQKGDKVAARRELTAGLTDYPSNPRLNQLRQEIGE